MKKLVLLVASLSILFFCLLFLNLMSGRGAYRINPDGFAKIQTGMSEKEVEEILGGPAGDYGDPGAEIVNIEFVPEVGKNLNFGYWQGDVWAISVDFDSQRRVVAKSICVFRNEEPLFRRFQRICGRCLRW